MAVVQISKIQIRRGLKGVDGIPQLASGEFAWCIDSKQLYIGGGTVAEGASQEENVEILTTKSNIFSLTDNYSYKVNFPTGASQPFARSLQDRLDERLNASSFNIQGLPDEEDETTNIQRAIDRLYKDSLGGESPDTRAILEFSPGIFQFSDPIYIYSYTRIVGAGQGRTIFRYTPSPSAQSQPAFIFVDDPQTNPPTQLSQRQCRNISLEGFTLEVQDPESPALNLKYVKNSRLENIDIKGLWTYTDLGQFSRAINMESFIGNDPYDGIPGEVLITCESNIFKNVKINNFKEGLVAKKEIRNNIFDSMIFYKLEDAIVFGYDTTSTPLVTNLGPKNNTIKNSQFDDIKRHGIKIWQGKNNIINKNTFKFVGNGGGAIESSLYGQIETNDVTNIIIDNYFDRHAAQVRGGSAYVSEITGSSFNQNTFPNTVPLQYIEGNPKQFLFRFPLPKSSTAGVGPVSCMIEIDYLYQSLGQYRRIRKGTLSLLLDSENSLGLSKTNLVDNYEYLGKGLENPQVTDEDEFIIFEAQTELKNNTWQVLFFYKYKTIPALGENLEERGNFTYTYRILS
jgi:hypothetical protein